MTGSGKDVVPLPDEHAPHLNGEEVVSPAGKNAVLRENTFGVVVDEEGSFEDKVVRLLNLLPMAFTVLGEARETVARLGAQVGGRPAGG